LRALIEATKVFRSEEVDVAVELMDAAIDDPQQRDYVLATYVDETDNVRGYYCYGPTPMTQSTYDLYWIAVDPASHGSGIGSALLAHCEQRIAAAGGSLIVVETSSLPKYDATRRFYRRHRYDETARLRGYYAPDDDLVIFTKHL
jgi:ribosomal protein S18 acetylase RimI-like enzyme